MALFLTLISPSLGSPTSTSSHFKTYIENTVEHKQWLLKKKIKLVFALVSPRGLRARGLWWPWPSPYLVPLWAPKKNRRNEQPRQRGFAGKILSRSKITAGRRSGKQSMEATVGQGNEEQRRGLTELLCDCRLTRGWYHSSQPNSFPHPSAVCFLTGWRRWLR